MKKEKKRADQGFTLIELMVAMAITLVVMGAIFTTFKSQQDSYVVQDQVTRMQQNLRGAMYVMTRDIQMAGYYTNFDSGYCNNTDLDDDGTNELNVRPLIYGVVDNTTSGDDIKDGTDVIVIVKACHERDATTGNLIDNDTLTSGESATGTTISLSAGRSVTGGIDLDGDGDDDLNDSSQGKNFGLLVKSDLGKADFFEISAVSSGTITTKDSLSNSYDEGDLIFRADVVIYRVDEASVRPCLGRKNLGSNNGFRVVAEDIDSLQVRYELNDGTWVEDPSGSEASIRAVEISLLAKTANRIRGYTDPNTYTLGADSITPGDNFRRKVLKSVIETRNIGL
ncbi:MAG: prepilin-type N-terminal cleavage/methylation domain-containing protein [Desulfobacterales bacterium]|nr:prepilin-type N-terminal cleavage/methylation domain-containing protein [Desulfobacterales bacterium]